MARHGKKPKGGRNIPLAILTGVSLFALVFVCLFITPYLFLALAVFASILAIIEVYYCLKLKNIVIGIPPIIIGAAGMIAASFFYGSAGLTIVYYLTVAMLILYCSLDHIDYKLKITQVSYSVMVCTWIPFLVSFLVLIYILPFGAYKVALSVIIVSFVDLGGLVIGSRFGKHKLAKKLSPKKSWEGLAGGFVFGFIMSILGSMVFEFFSIYFIDSSVYSLIGIVHRLIFAIVATAFGLLGDLLESSLKRFVKIKDMGSLLAGHGGIMDRLDSTLMAAPILYLLFLFL
ncbi:MAG: phosphatidate cytidylyltransferase [Bifidobacteriaceae bacterium]|jgi:phosphatidate cytidylyltransferase|nr:phosphatidate cytidylyltransferase [Bifidobacteriaceae bacterium]